MSTELKTTPARLRSPPEQEKSRGTVDNSKTKGGNRTAACTTMTVLEYLVTSLALPPSRVPTTSALCLPRFAQCFMNTHRTTRHVQEGHRRCDHKLPQTPHTTQHGRLADHRLINPTLSRVHHHPAERRRKGPSFSSDVTRTRRSLGGAQSEGCASVPCLLCDAE